MAKLTSGRYRARARQVRRVVVEVRVGDGPPQTVQTTDINIAGAFLDLGAPPAAGSKLMVVIPTDGDEPAIELAAEVRWVRATPAREAGVGIEFVGLDAETRVRLERRLRSVSLEIVD